MISFEEFISESSDHKPYAVKFTTYCVVKINSYGGAEFHITQKDNWVYEQHQKMKYYRMGVGHLCTIDKNGVFHDGLDDCVEEVDNQYAPKKFKTVKVTEDFLYSFLKSRKNIKKMTIVNNMAPMKKWLHKFRGETLVNDLGI